MATRIVESVVIAHPLHLVWSHVRTCTFAFWSAVEKAEVEGGSVDSVGSIRTVTFKDGTVQKFRILEISDLDEFVTYEVIESNPPAQVLAAVHSLRLKKVTSDNSTFVEWSSDFSAGDSTAAAVEDARFKRKEAFADLEKALAK